MAFEDIYNYDPKKDKKTKNLTDVNNLLYGETVLVPDAEDNQEVSNITAGVAGIASGTIKVVEGVVSLGSELIDLGFDTNTAASVEQFFDKINPFEEVAEQKAIGKLTQALVQIGVPAGAGAKLATKLATKALRAKKAGRYLNLKSKNLQKGLTKAKELELSTGKKYAAITLGGAAGETTVADVEDIGTFGDVFEAGPTELDRNVEADPSADASRKILNRLKFGAESLVLTPFVYGAGSGIKALATRGKELAYSNKALERTFDKIGGYFRPRGSRPQELFRAQRTEKGRLMADTNFAMEQVKLIDKEVDKIFPELKSFLNKTTEDNRAQFLKEINDLMFSGDLKKGFPKDAYDAFLKRTKKYNVDNKGIKNIVNTVGKVRNRFSELLDITAEGAAGIIPAGAKNKLQINLRNLMGDRIKQYIGTTYRIFQDQNFGFYSRYKPTDDAVNKAKELFKRYAAKNKNPITDQEAEMLVDNVLKQARQYNPKTKLPTFRYDNLAQGADTAENIKTFAQTLTKELPDGSKELRVIGKGSKIFRDLFGEVEDARYSIFEGMNRLGTIARKNQLFDEILDVDDSLKAAATATTPAGSRGFFFSNILEARRNLPNQDIVKIDPYVQEFFQDGVLINRLQGMYTTKDIAEAFGNASKVSNWMRGDSTNKFAQTASWAYRNLFLTPKAGSQYAKTILSVPTHFRNFLSSSAFALANGAVTSPITFVRAMKKAKDSVQVGLRDPKAMEYYRELLELGVTNSNVRVGDLTNLMKDAKVFEKGNIATDSILKPMIKSLGKAGEAARRSVRKGASFMQDAYVAEDDFWKIAMYETELARRTANYAKAGIKKTPAELKEEAARIVRNTIPNYAYVGEFVRAMRATPFGNFMSWPSEVFRTGYGIIRQALDDIRDPITGSINYFKSTNPNKATGLSRLVGGTVTFSALPYGVVEGSKAIFGVSDEEAKAVQESAVAPWSENSQLIIVKDPETGELSYSDWSHNNVYDTLTRPFTTVLRNVQQGIEDEEFLLKGFEEGLTKAAAETANPFIGESIFTEAMNDIVIRGGRTKEGYQLYTEETPRNEKWMRRFKHVIETQLPQYKQLFKVYDSATGQPDENGDVIEIDESLAGVFGFRLIPVKPEKALGFHINDYQEGRRNSTREFTGGPEGTLKPMKTANEVIERYFVANKALFLNAQEMKKHMENMETLNVSPGNIANTFVKRGLKSDYRYLNGNVFDTYYPSKNIQRKFIEIAQETNQPNPFIEAQQVINKMYKDFSKQSLDKEWNFKLEDYLPSAQPQSRVPLPVQPTPNPSVVQAPIQPNTMQTGLTPVEQGLLSDEEKMMRLRQRGLA